MTLLGLKASSEKPVPLGDDYLVVGAAGDKVVVALPKETISAAAFMQPNSSLLAVTSVRRSARAVLQK